MSATGAGHDPLLIRRKRMVGELARGCSPRPVPLATSVRAVGPRWRMKETVQVGKGLTGLDGHHVRRYASWVGWVTPWPCSPDGEGHAYWCAV